MRFNRKDYVSHVFSHPGFAPQLVEKLHGDFDEKKDGRRPEIANKHVQLSTELAYATSTKDYLLTESALSVLTRISVTRKFDLSLLKPPAQKLLYTFWLGDEMGYRILWTPDEIVTIGVSRQQEQFIRSPSGGILQGSEYFSISHYLDLKDQPVLTHCEDKEFGLIQWTLQTLLFLELTDPQFLYLPPNKKFATSPLGYTSNNPTGITIVTSKWNFHVVRTDGFGVSGHYRAQRVGVGRDETRLVWINPYNKKGYKRLAKT